MATYLGARRKRATEQNTAFSTYTFSKSFDTKIKKADTTNIDSSAKIIGLHIENVIVDMLDKRAQEGPLKAKGRRTPPPNPKATQALRAAAAQPGKAGKAAKIALENADTAAQNAARLIMDLLEKELQDTEKKEYRVDLTGLGGSSPAGDIGIIVNGKKIVIELKYQTSGTHATRWSGLKTSQLFGDDVYMNYLAQKGVLNNDIEQDEWIETVQGYLGDFLSEEVGPAKEQVLYFLQKGQAIPKNMYQDKYVVHMRGQTTTVDATLQSLEELEASLSGVALSGVPGSIYSLGAQDKIATVDYTLDDEVAAQAGIATKTKTDFTIEFYIAQKLLNRALLLKQ